MTRDELKKYISETYGAVPNDTFGDCPSREVFFGPSGQKCFAVLEDISALQLSSSVYQGKKKAGDAGPYKTVLTLMCDPEQADFLMADPAFYPAYLTKRRNWISMDVSMVPDEKILLLLNTSFAASSVKRNRPKYPEDFFRQLYGEPVGDRDLADCLIDDLPNYEKRNDRPDKRLYRTIDGIFRKGRTVEEAGWEMGISGQRVCQLRAKGLRIILFNYRKAGSPSSASDYKKNIGEYRRIAKAYTAETEFNSRGPVFPDTLLSTLGFTRQILNILYCCGRTETVSQFMALPYRECIPATWHTVLNEIEVRREEIKGRLRERTQEEKERLVLADIWRSRYPEYAGSGNRSLSPDDSIYAIAGLGFAGSVFGSLYDYGIEKVSQLMQLDTAEEIPGIGSEGWEIIRFLKMGAACRMEKTGDGCF